MLQSQHRQGSRALLLLLTTILVALPAAALTATQGMAATGATETAAWTKLARSTSIPLFRPTKTAGLRFAFTINATGDPGCQNTGRQSFRAFYSGRVSGRTLEIFQGYPRYCTDSPLRAPVVRHVAVRKARATLYDLCVAYDCARTAGAWALEWCEQGTTITVKGVDVTANAVITTARSMREVIPRKARPCVGTREATLPA